MNEIVNKFLLPGDLDKFMPEIHLRLDLHKRHDKVYGDFEDFPRRTASNKVLRDKTLNIAKYLKYDGYVKPTNDRRITQTNH